MMAAAIGAPMTTTTMQSSRIAFAHPGTFLQVFKAFARRFRKRRSVFATRDLSAYANNTETLYLNVIECPGRPYLIGAGTYLVASMLMSDRLHNSKN
jgi:hypothetical protein